MSIGHDFGVTDQRAEQVCVACGARIKGKGNGEEWKIVKVRILLF